MLYLPYDIEDFSNIDLDGFISLDILNLFDVSDDLYEFVQRSIIPDNMTAVACHSDNEGRLCAYVYDDMKEQVLGGYEYGDEMIAELVRRSSWVGEDIMMMVCEAGVGYNPPALRLANALGCRVWGPNDLFWIDPSGLYYINDKKVVANNDLYILSREHQQTRWICFK